MSFRVSVMLKPCSPEGSQGPRAWLRSSSSPGPGPKPGPAAMVLGALSYLEGHSLKIPASIIRAVLENLATPLDLHPSGVSCLIERSIPLDSSLHHQRAKQPLPVIGTPNIHNSSFKFHDVFHAQASNNIVNIPRFRSSNQQALHPLNQIASDLSHVCCLEHK